MMVLFSIYLLFCVQLTVQPISCNFDSQSQAIVIQGLDLRKEMAMEKAIAVYFGEMRLPTEFPKVLGRFKRKGNSLLFYAKYGFSPGQSYTVVVDNQKLAGTSSANAIQPYHSVIKIPDFEVESETYVRNVYPSIGELPMNQLKLYVEFSAPMRQGGAAKHLKLYRMPGKEIDPEAFLSMPEELWGPERKRLTVLFDPGRIKRGVGPNLQLGLPLVEGGEYCLVIEKEWMDSNGAELTESFKKNFSVTKSDRQSPNPEDWHIIRPAADSQDPIIIDFMEAMDFGLLQSAIVIRDQSYRQLKGQIHISDQEKKWEFTPQNAWSPGDYNIVINARLEDLAGNNLNRKFEVDLLDSNDIPKDLKEIKIPFKIGK